MMDCIFCHKEKITTDFVYEDEMVMAFMDMDPINEGHVLLVPKDHYLDVDEMPDEVLSHLMIVSKKIVSALKIFISQMVTASCKMVANLMISGIITYIFFRDIKAMVSVGHMAVMPKT